MVKKEKMNNNLTATWNREDRDLLIELRTDMQGIRTDISDLKGSFSTRLLNLESNAVSKIELEPIRKDIDASKKMNWMTLGGLAVIEIVLRFVIK